MNRETRPAPSSSDVAPEVANFSAGLGIITIPLFPFALPALVLVIEQAVLRELPMLRLRRAGSVSAQSGGP